MKSSWFMICLDADRRERGEMVYIEGETKFRRVYRAV